MLTIPRPFTVYINFIEAVGLEGIHEKNSKGREEQKQWATAHFDFSVAIESLGPDRVSHAAVGAGAARASWQA